MKVSRLFVLHDWVIAGLLNAVLLVSAHAQGPVVRIGGQPSSARVASEAHNIGAQKAIAAAHGRVVQQGISYAEAALIGLAVIGNDNDNDGEPGTYTGGSGSNMAGGSG
jgi:hypothetical protein